MEQLHFLLGFLVCTTGLFVFLSLNPVHSVLFLILTFFNSSLILLLINAEFLALTFVIVYVGAIAVLFLFVVMMLNLKIIPKESSFSSNFLFFLMGIVFLIQFFLFLENRVNS
jgi:NADH-quinone oxidoreductase subunit J